MSDKLFNDPVFVGVFKVNKWQCGNEKYFNCLDHASCNTLGKLVIMVLTHDIVQVGALTLQLRQYAQSNLYSTRRSKS